MLIVIYLRTSLLKLPFNTFFLKNLIVITEFSKWQGNRCYARLPQRSLTAATMYS